MSRYLKSAVAVSAICALAAIAFCAVELSLVFRAARAQELGIAQTIVHLDATITDLDRTVQIAGGTLDQARKIERDNRHEIAQVNEQTLATLQHVDALVQSFDVTQKQAGASISQTSAALVPVIEQTRKDLAQLEPAIRQVEPLLMRTTDIAVNVSNATADVEHEIHKLVYPPPRKWYEKYFLDPLRTAAHLVTIPIR
jgi:hypothetical protein